MDDITVRASEAFRVRICASAAAEGGIDEPSGPPAKDGLAVHKVAELMDLGKEPDIKSIATTHGADVGEVTMLAGYLPEAFDALSVPGGEVKVERELTGMVTRGRADRIVFTPENAQAYIDDWKTGWKRDVIIDQLLSYADGFEMEFGWPQHDIIGRIIFLRHQEIVEHRITLDSLVEFRKDMQRQFKYIGKRWVPGDHCQYCRHQTTCQAAAAQMRAGVTALIEVKNPVAITRDDLARLHPEYLMAKKAIAAYEKALKQAVYRGELSVPGGTIRNTEKSTETILPDKAWAVLTEKHGFTQEQMSRVMSVKKTKVMEMAADGAEKGAGAGIKRAVMADLESAGAVRTSTRTEQRLVKARKS